MPPNPEVTKTFPVKSYKSKYLRPALRTVNVLEKINNLNDFELNFKFDLDAYIRSMYNSLRSNVTIASCGHLTIHGNTKSVHLLEILFSRVIRNHHSVSYNDSWIFRSRWKES